MLIPLRIYRYASLSWHFFARTMVLSPCALIHQTSAKFPGVNMKLQTLCDPSAGVNRKMCHKLNYPVHYGTQSWKEPWAPSGPVSFLGETEARVE